MSKRGENITKRKDGRWEARYIKGYEKGKAVYGYLYGKSYAEAKQKKEDALRTSKELSPTKQTETFNDLLNCFLLQKKYCVMCILLWTENVLVWNCCLQTDFSQTFSQHCRKNK